MQALRTLTRQPAFTALVTAVLGLGIGITTAIYSFFHTLLIQPFPYPDPGQIVRIVTVDTTTRIERGVSLPDIEDWRRHTKLLSAAGAHTTFDSHILTPDGFAQPIRMSQLDPEALIAVGVQPRFGRLLHPNDNRPGSDVNKALISQRLWREHFGADAAILGKPVRTSQRSLTIVGVMPDGFGYPDRVDLWTPMETYYAASAAPKRRRARFYLATARIQPGVTLAQAEADLNRVCGQLERQYPVDNAAIRAKLIPLREAETGPLRPYLHVLMAASAMVWLICCVNVAGMLMARGSSRKHDLAVRLALGAGARGILSPVLAEAAWLGSLGGLLGIALAFAGVRVILLLIPVALPSWMQVRISAPVLVFALMASLFAIVLSASAPALQALRGGVNLILREGGRTVAQSGRARHWLVVVEIALSLALAIGAGLMLRAFVSLSSVEAGFHAENILVARVSNFLPGPRAERATILSAQHERTLEALRAIPGVTAAAATNALPYTGVYQNSTNARGISAVHWSGSNGEESKQLPMVVTSDVSAGFLDVMRIPLLQGRAFDRRDTPSSPMVVMINLRAAQTLWPGRDPIGQQLTVGAPSPDNPPCRVIGVTGNVRHEPGEPAAGIEFYYPYTQYPAVHVYFVIRTAGNPQSLSPAVRHAILSMRKDTPIIFIRPLHDLMSDTLWQRRLWGVLFAAFAGLALLLAGVGLYGLISYSVTQRARELGVRAALGAQPAGLLLMVLAGGARLVAFGALFGAAGSVALARLIAHLLAGVPPLDPISFAAALLLLSASSFFAILVPALRAASVNPLRALRES